MSTIDTDDVWDSLKNISQKIVEGQPTFLSQAEIETIIELPNRFHQARKCECSNERPSKCGRCITLLGLTTLTNAIANSMFSLDSWNNIVDWEKFLESLTPGIQRYVKKLFDKLQPPENPDAETEMKLHILLGNVEGLMSKKNISRSEVRRSCVELLITRWKILCVYFCAKLENCRAINLPIDVRIQSLYSFLSLWKKTFRRLQELRCNESNVEWTDSCLKVVYENATVLLDLITAVAGSLPKYNVIKCLDVLNLMGSQDRHVTTGIWADIQIGLADSIIAWIRDDRMSEISCKQDVLGFGWKMAGADQIDEKDVQLERKLCLLCLRFLILYSQNKDLSDALRRDVVEILKATSCQVQRFFPSISAATQVPTSASNINAIVGLTFCTDERPLVEKSENLFNWLPELFVEEDDQWIEVLLCLLDLHLLVLHGLDCQEDSHEDFPAYQIHLCFLQFLQTLSYDHSVLVDLLSSPETRFLLFLLRYLKLVTGEWDKFVSAHKLQEYNRVHDTLNSIQETHRAIFVNEDNASDGMKRDQQREQQVLVVWSACKELSSLTDSPQNPAPFIEGERSSTASDLGQSDPSNCFRLGALANIQAYSVDSADEDEEAFQGEGTKSMEPLIMSNIPLTKSEDIVTGSQCVLLDETMSTLIRLRLQLERLEGCNLFPYSVGPLANAIETCEALYES